MAAQTARQVIQQRIREAEREAQLEYFNKQEGEIVSGIVQATTHQAVTLGLDMKAEGIMPRNQQIGGERFRLHDRVRALLLEAKASPRGPQLILSRAHRNFLRRLLENEVPEIYHGLVEVRSIAREPGHRSKVAVAALQAGVDPVGACVGIRGVRIQAIVRELNDEKIDVIEWNPDPEAYIAKALSPARVNGVYLNEHARGTKTATVVVPDDQLKPGDRPGWAKRPPGGQSHFLAHRYQEPSRSCRGRIAQNLNPRRFCLPFRAGRRSHRPGRERPCQEERRPASHSRRVQLVEPIC